MDTAFFLWHGVAALAGQTRGDDAGVVEHHDVALSQQTGQVPDAEIGEITVLRDMQHACGIARARRALRNTRLRQVKVE